MNRFLACGLAPFIFLGLFSCAKSNEGSSSHSFRLYDEKGVTIAETSGGPKYTQPLFSYEPVTTLVEDPLNGESLLFQPHKILMDEEGWFFVEDWGAERIAVFDPGGGYSHSIGRKGQGPGEFGLPDMLSVSGGIVMVWDDMLYRTTTFTTDGTLLQIVKSPPSLTPDEMYLGPEGSLVGIKLFTTQMVMEKRQDRYRSMEAVVVDVGDDTTCQITTPRIRTSRGFYLADIDAFSIATIYFKGSPVIRYVPDTGLLMTTGEEPVVEVYSLNGEPVRIIRIEMERERVSQEERSAIISEAREQAESAEDEMSRAVRLRRLELMEIPDSKDFWSDLIIDDAGFIWLERIPDYTVASAERGSTWMVLSPEGEYLGSTTWPLAGGKISQTHFLGFDTDEETGERVGKVFRLWPAVEGLDYPR